MGGLTWAFPYSTQIVSYQPNLCDLADFESSSQDAVRLTANRSELSTRQIGDLVRVF